MLLSNKIKREYSEMCGFVKAPMLLAIVRSNALLLRGAKYKEEYIRKRKNLEDGEVMALLHPW